MAIDSTLLMRLSCTFAILLMLISGCAINQAPPSETSPSFPELNLPENFSIMEKNEFNDGSRAIASLKASKGGSIIEITRVRNITLGEANSSARKKMLTIDSLYLDRLSPYPGPLSNSIECAAPFLPVLVEKEWKENFHMRYSLFASPRLTFGVCTEDLAAYKASIGFFYCNVTRSFYETGYFVPIAAQEAEGAVADNMAYWVSCPSIP